MTDVVSKVSRRCGVARPRPYHPALVRDLVRMRPLLALPCPRHSRPTQYQRLFRLPATSRLLGRLSPRLVDRHDFPMRAPSRSLRVPTSRSAAASRWALTDNIDVYENALWREKPAIFARWCRFRRNRSFASFRTARAPVHGARLSAPSTFTGATTPRRAAQYKVRSDRSDFAIDPRVDAARRTGHHGAALHSAGG